MRPLNCIDGTGTRRASIEKDASMRDLAWLWLKSIGFWCVALMLIAGCESKEPQVIDPKDLQSIKLGEVIRLDGLLKKPAEAERPAQ